LLTTLSSTAEKMKSRKKLSFNYSRTYKETLEKLSEDGDKLTELKKLKMQ
jgi:hypothetical protein